MNRGLFDMIWIFIFLIGLVSFARADDLECPKFPSSKTIAEQVVEDLKAFPQPVVLHCNKMKVRQSGTGGFIGHCAVFFPNPVPLQ